MGRANPRRRSGSRRSRSRSETQRRAGLDRHELITAVCRYFCKGKTVREIQEFVNAEYDVKLNREEPYALIREAARRGWLRFEPPKHLSLEEQLRWEFPWLQGIHVVRTATVRDVAHHSARALIGLLQTFRRKDGREKVHIGFAGGHSMRALARAFSELLCESFDDMPETIVFHSISAGFDSANPTTDPNAFFTFFLEPLIQVAVEFMGLSAPSMVKPGDIASLRDLAEIDAAFRAVDEIDILVTSGTEWQDDESALRHRMQRSERSIEVLEQAGCIGDMLWRPIADDGPIEAATEIRALTLVELGELETLIQRGKRVLLMLAPCGRCHAPKGRLLGCVLNQNRSLITDLVVDSRSVQQMKRAG